MSGLFPVMISFGIENNLETFRLYEVETKDTFHQLLQKFGPEDWENVLSSIQVKVSHSKAASFDKFNLRNTVDLVIASYNRAPPFSAQYPGKSPKILPLMFI